MTTVILHYDIKGSIVAIEVDCYQGTTTAGGPDPSTTDDIRATIEGEPVIWDRFLADVAEEFGLKSTNEAEEFIQDEAWDKLT